MPTATCPSKEGEPETAAPGPAPAAACGGGGVSTRTKIGIGAGATAVVAGAAAVAAARAGLFQSGLHITVNGSDHQVQVDPNTPLLYVLRNEVGLKGLRFGCGLAECGACTVQLDGRAIRSCITKVSQASGKAVTTLEGLGTEANPSKLQKAFTILPPAFADAGRLQPPLKLADDLSQVRPPEPDRRRGGG